MITKANFVLLSLGALAAIAALPDKGLAQGADTGDHAINKGVLVTLLSLCPEYDGDTGLWGVGYGLSPDMITVPVDPEAEDDCQFKHVRFVVSQKANTPQDGDDGVIDHIALIFANGQSANVVPKGPAQTYFEITFCNKLSYCVTWLSPSVVTIQQIEHAGRGCNACPAKPWEIVSVQAFGRFTQDGVKRFECRAGLAIEEAATKADLPQDPIMRVHNRKDGRGQIQTPIWGALSTTNAAGVRVVWNDQDQGFNRVFPDQFIWIQADSTMPAMQAYIFPMENVNCGWKIQIQYQRLQLTNDDPYPRNMPWRQLNGQQPWNIAKGAQTEMVDEVRGGTAVVTLHRQGVADWALRFYIRGRNPADLAAKNYIMGLANAPWYAYAIAKQESYQGSAAPAGQWYNQFNEPNRNRPAGPSPNGMEFTPNESFDAGVGIMQITNPAPTPQQMWSWKDNCSTGVAVMQAKLAAAQAFLQGQRAQAGGVPIPDQTIAGVTFSDQQGGARRPFEDADGIKLYNGMGSFVGGGIANHHYVEWDPVAHRWVFYPTNAWRDKQGVHPNPYIENVLRKLE
jgi:hypothetical protein